MAIAILAVCCILLSVIIPPVHLIVPPKTPVLSGFGPAAIGSYRKLVCDAYQPGAGTITYKWYKYSTHRYVEDWESRGPIHKSRDIVFNPLTKRRQLYYTNGTASGRYGDLVSGKYKCRATNSAGTRDSEWGELYVYERCPLYTVSVSPARPVIGSNFTLKCYIPNPSGMTVNWFKKFDGSSAVTVVALATNKGCKVDSYMYYHRYYWSNCFPPSISSPTRTFNLNVTSAHTSDSAYWTCQDIGLTCNSNPIKVVLQARPGTSQITGFPSGPVAEGSQVNLKCVASPTGDAYDWYKDGSKVATSLTYDFEVTKGSAGVYKCVVRNSAGSSRSSDKTLVVYYKADSVVVSSGKTSSYVGETDKFTCTVSGGNPTPSVTIYLKRSGETPVEVTKGQDRVMAKEDNQAEYFCVAKVPGYPTIDKTSSKKTYNVTYPPTAKLSSSPTSVKEGDTLRLTCEASGGNPAVYSYTWYYKGTQIPNTSSREYIISSMQYTEAGQYHCRVVNSPRGIADALVTIDVLCKAKWDPKKPMMFTVASKPTGPARFTLHLTPTLDLPMLLGIIQIKSWQLKKTSSVRKLMGHTHRTRYMYWRQIMENTLQK